jgi:hypothetical protein
MALTKRQRFYRNIKADPIRYAKYRVYHKEYLKEYRQHWEEERQRITVNGVRKRVFVLHRPLPYFEPWELGMGLPEGER